MSAALASWLHSSWQHSLLCADFSILNCCACCSYKRLGPAETSCSIIISEKHCLAPKFVYFTGHFRQQLLLTWNFVSEAANHQNPIYLPSRVNVGGHHSVRGLQVYVWDSKQRKFVPEAEAAATGQTAQPDYNQDDMTFVADEEQIPAYDPPDPVSSLLLPFPSADASCPESTYMIL